MAEWLYAVLEVALIVVIAVGVWLVVGVGLALIAFGVLGLGWAFVAQLPKGGDDARSTRPQHDH